MVRWALGVTRKNKIRNEYVRETAKIAKLGDKLRNARLRWYGHVKRREEGYVGKTIGFILFCFICHIYPPFTRKRIVSLYFGREVRTRLGVAFFEVYGSPVFHIKVGRPVKCLAQGHNKRTCRLVLHNLP